MHRRPRSSSIAPLALLALSLVGTGVSLAGCSEPPPAPAPAPEAAPTPPRPPPADALEAALREREPTEAFALTPFGRPFRAHLQAGQQQTFTAVLQAGFCFKLLGQGDEAVGELELDLFDPHDVLAQRDTLEGPRAALGGERQICPEESGAYRARVTVREGGGDVLAQWYVNQ